MVNSIRLSQLSIGCGIISNAMTTYELLAVANNNPRAIAVRSHSGACI